MSLSLNKKMIALQLPNISEEESANSHKENEKGKLKKRVIPSTKKKLECQSDVYVAHELWRKDLLEDLGSQEDGEERKTNSDIHEMFFVDELFKEDLKFENLLLK